MGEFVGHDRLAAAETATPKLVQLTMDFASFASLANGVKVATVSAASALPAGARIVGHDIGEGTFTAFDDAAHGTYTLEQGFTTAGNINDVMTSLNVAAGQTGFPKTGTNGALGFFNAPAPAGGVPSIKLTSSVDLNTVTQGHLVANIWYVTYP